MYSKMAGIKLIASRNEVVVLWCTYIEHLMHEISDLMQGFKAVFFHHFVIVSDINYHNMVKKYCILMYTM